MISRISLVVLLCATSLLAQKPAPPSAEELSAITARGKRLAEYHRAAHAAIAAVKAIHPVPGNGTIYLGEQSSSGWAFWFGRWDETGKNFLSGYSARQDGPTLKFIARESEPNEELPASMQIKTLTLHTALQKFTAHSKQPYSIAVLPRESGGFYVYIYPAQETTIGGTRFAIAKDGTTVEDLQSHGSSNAPDDTDVFHVLRQENPLPEYVGTKYFVYGIGKDGSIKILKK